MSIVIRLQNLPITAKSGDIRKFFGGLRIPDGGVHILGGDSGDAFIVFLSDEDGRLAMRKDGGKIKDSRVKLFLSSRMEMQHEIERVTKIKPDDPFFDEEPPEKDNFRKRSNERKRRPISRSPTNERKRRPISRSPTSERKRRPISRSPTHERKRRPISRSPDWRVDELRLSKDYPMQMSPASYESREFSPKRYRSRSPRRSRSPVASFPSSRSSSYKSKYKGDRRRKSTSPFSKEFHTLPSDIDLPHSLRENSDSSSILFRSERQAELEKRITEELEKNSLLRKRFSDQESMSHLYPESFRESFPLKEELDDFMFPYPSGSSDLDKFRHSIPFDRNQPGYLSPDLLTDEERRNINHGFYIALHGLHHNWGFREIQLILKGHYAPQNNIRFERDEVGLKTGTAFVKLAHGEDFEEIMKKGICFFNGIKVIVTECPEFIAYKYFRSELELNDSIYIPKNRSLCYTLKGLPFSCTYDDIINFFQGFEISDIIIFYGEDGRAKGTGFVSFSNWKDFEGAFSLNGKKIGHRYIEMLPSTDKEMQEAKKTQPGGNIPPFNKILSERKLPFRRPLCATLTGLPFFVTPKKIVNFFSESGLKPDAIHVTLNRKKKPDGRAFVAFTNFLDFDLALKFHGKRFGDNIVCVKQILYDEMIKILDSTKARHHFETPTPAASVVEEPEKVPYLWVPPDEEQEKETNVRDQEFNKLSTSVSSPVLPYNTNFSGGYPPKDPYKRNFNNPFYPQPVSNKVEDILKPGKSNINSQFGTAPANEIYSSTNKYEENIKSSRLSPEYEAALLDFLNKTRMPSTYKGHNRKSKSPERRNRKMYGDRSLNEAKNVYKDDKGPKPYGDSDKKCIVQLSNIDVSVGTRDLINFLHGFNFDEKTLIRRYTLEGEPTPDVRVTFNNVYEAKRAIKSLNKRILHDKKVNIFMV